MPCLAIAYAFGAVWVVAADETLTRLDPGSLRPTGAVANVAQSVEHYEPKIAVGDDALWVADAVSNSVARVDPVGLRVTRRVAKGGAGVAVGSSGIWSTDSFGSVWRVADGRQAKVRTGAGAVDVAAGGGFLWVVNRFAGTLVRVDPRALRVTETIHLRGSPIAVAYGDGYLAVAVRAST